MIPPLDADRLLAFTTVARERGFSRAARVLGKTQSAVSQAVIQLERDVGAALFVRGGRATLLTDAGVALLQHTDRIFSEMNAARDHIASLGELKTGTLVVGTSDTLACHFLPPVFRAFRAKYPGIDLRLENRSSPATAHAVAERRVDVGVVVLPLPEGQGGPRGQQDRVVVTPLVAHVDAVICQPSHPLALRKRAKPRDLENEPLLLLDRSTGSRAYVETAFEHAGVRPHVTMETGSVEVLKRLVELGFGVSIVPEMAVRAEVSQGALGMVEFSSGEPKRQIGLMTLATEALGRAAEAFVTLAAAELRAR